MAGFPDGSGDGDVSEIGVLYGCSTVGVPVVAEVGLGGSVVGIALQLFGNLNAKAPFAGLGVTVPVGWMP